MIARRLQACFEQQVGSDCRLHLVRGAVREAGLRMLADIRIGPSVESAFLNADQIIGWQQITEAISFLHQGVEITGLRMECERRWVTRAGGKRRLI